jgi:hypothetical protein
MRVRNVSIPEELGFGENGMYRDRKINRDKDGEINDGHNPKFWRLENKSLHEMTIEERKQGNTDHI